MNTEKENQNGEETKMFTMRLEKNIIDEMNRLVETYKTTQSDVIRISLRIALPETEERLKKINIAKGLRESLIEE